MDTVKNMINNALKFEGNIELSDICVIRIKDGVHVYRTAFNNKPIVVKYFEKKEYRREIDNYKLLHELGITTIHLYGYTDKCIIMEDIGFSNIWRLGKQEDVEDVSVARSLARWYFELHEKGKTVAEIRKLYSENDFITEENITMLSKKLPQAKETFNYLLKNLSKLKQFIDKLEITLTYNDFFWTNLIVGNDKTKAFMFDYNLLGSSYRYSDIRNVKSSLYKKAGEEFVYCYDELFYNKYGASRDKKEEKIDAIISTLVGLISAYEKRRFPAWAVEDRRRILDRKFLNKVYEIVEYVD